MACRWSWSWAMSTETTVETNVKQAVPFFMVTDIEASLRFYIDGLGFAITNAWRPEYAKGRIQWCWLQLGSAALMLQEYWKDGRPGGAPDGPLGQGVSVCFMCADAIAIYHDLTSVEGFPRSGRSLATICGSLQCATRMATPCILKAPRMCRRKPSIPASWTRGTASRMRERQLSARSLAGPGLRMPVVTSYFSTHAGGGCRVYLADPFNPYQQSGRSSGAARWEETRRCLVHAIRPKRRFHGHRVCQRTAAGDRSPHGRKLSATLSRHTGWTSSRS